VAGFDRRQPADAGAEVDADARLVDLLIEAGILDRLHGRRDAELNEAVDATHLLVRQVAAGIEVPHLARDL